MITFLVFKLMFSRHSIHVEVSHFLLNLLHDLMKKYLIIQFILIILMELVIIEK